MNVTINGNEVSNVESAEACSMYSKTYTASWGVYAYLNQCKANKVARDFAFYGAGAGMFAAIPHPIAFAAGSVMAGYSGYLSTQLGYCADNYGQAYIRIRWSGFTDVSCR